MMRPFTALAVAATLAGCIESGFDECADGTICTRGLVCDDAHGGCVMPDQIADCAGKAQWDACSYPGEPSGVCDQGVCIPGGCGNGLREPSEACDDGNAIGDDGCSADCRSNEMCGNGVIDAALGEQCDDSNLLGHDGCGACRTERSEWTLAFGQHAPQAIAYDASRGRLVSFSYSKTWEWDGTAWSEVDASTSPRDRFYHQMVYDAARRRVVLFGGSGEDGIPLGDTWEYDGETWRNLSPGLSPPARWQHAMAYDAARERVVLFGGWGGGDDGAPLGDTWEWDGAEWREVTPEGSPTARTRASLAYDGARERVVLFGGMDASGGRADTWVWDGAGWDEVTPTSSPSARYDPQLVYHVSRRRVVLLPGHLPWFTPTPETWEWDGARWTRGDDLPSITDEVAGEAFYDPARGVVTLQRGGIQVWEWDGAWHDRSKRLAPPPAEPEVQVDGGFVAYDAARGRAVYFDGVETWEWTGTLWQRMAPATSPPRRDGHRLAYHAARGRVVLFGGSGSGDELADTWEWDGTTWRDVTPASSPPPRQGHALAYDSARELVVLFGGARCRCDESNCPCGGRRDTWTWDGSTWSDVTPTGSPRGRASHALAYDPGRDRVVLYGGASIDGGLTDTWEWDGAGWQARAPASDPGTQENSMAYDPGRGRVLLVAGDGYYGFPGDMWSWDGAEWTEVTPQQGPFARDWPAVLHDEARDRMVVLGAHRGLLPTTTWADDGASWQEVSPRPALHGRAFAYDARRAQVLFARAGIDRMQIWQSNVAGAGQLVEAAGAPPARLGHAVAHDFARDRLVLFGGWRGGLRADTWEWDGAAWRDRTGASAPPARQHHALAHDLARGRTVLFGGRGEGGLLGDTWEWDGSSWERVSTAGPAAREGHALAYDPGRGGVVLSGGAGAGGVLGDTWTWDGATWTEASGEAPPARQDHGLTYDARRARLLLFGGADALGARFDTWEWDGSSWQNLTNVGIGAPPATAGHALVYDAARARAMVMQGDVEQSVWDDDQVWLHRHGGDRYDDVCQQALDVDGDGLEGCGDPDCWGYCAPACPPDASCSDDDAPHCGDGACDAALETCRMCPEDCGAC